MDKWLNENLSQILDFPVPDDMIQYILQIENERDLDEYLMSLLDSNNKKHQQFIAEMKKKQASSKDQVGYKKVHDTGDESIKANERKKGKIKGKESKENKQVPHIVTLDRFEKKKPKFVNLYSQEGKHKSEILLKGRHKCDCEAKRHDLINNCLNCGRVVCKQEGAGPCLFCGEIVCTPRDQNILASNTKQADQLYNKLKNQKINTNLEESIKQRDQLLEYDCNGAQCTNVIDDELDYYQSNNTWLSAKQREKLRKIEAEMNERKNMSRLDKRVNVTFDFAGRAVTEETPADDFAGINGEEILNIIESSDTIESHNICPNIEIDQPMYIPSEDFQEYVGRRPLNAKNILQDKEYLELSDSGLCLSMHQPYASLLVAGIKIHEGRTWYTAHRGRLWIASTSKLPKTEEIANIQHGYRVLKDERIIFPETYPSGSLLGCVTVVDVLPQEEYRKLYPEGESDSPYVLICENFYTLPIKFPIQGKHKIYKLDPKIHQAALRIMEKNIN